MRCSGPGAAEVAATALDVSRLAYHRRQQGELEMKQWLIVAGVMFVLVASPIVAGQGTGTGASPVTGQKPTNPKQAENPDGMFMRTASQSSMAEVAHGELATKNASSQEVKNFAQRMVDDHSKANAELKALASKKQTTLPAELGP